MTTVAVVMPVYNEADGIAEFLTEIDESCPGYAVFVVNDCSTDATLEVIGNLDLQHVNLHVVTNDRNRGHGPSTLRALGLGLESGASLIVAVDGDGQIHARDLFRMVEKLQSGTSSIVEGIRVHRNESAYRRVVSWVTRTITGVRAGQSVPDANTPFRIYRREVLVDLLEVVPSDSMVPNLWMSIAGRRRGLRVQSLEVQSRKRRGNVAEGSTWGQSWASLPSRRFMFFCVRALYEWVHDWKAVKSRLARCDASGS